MFDVAEAMSWISGKHRVMRPSGTARELEQQRLLAVRLLIERMSCASVARAPVNRILHGSGIAPRMPQ
jgi:hypothetical protein